MQTMIASMQPVRKSLGRLSTSARDPFVSSSHDVVVVIIVVAVCVVITIECKASMLTNDFLPVLASLGLKLALALPPSLRLVSVSRETQ